MTGPDPDTDSSGTRPISVAELLARNGTVGAPAVTRRRRRRRGDSDTVTVAELTAEIPVIREQIRELDHAPADEVAPEPVENEAASENAAAPENQQEQPKAPYWTEPGSPWPASPPPMDAASGPALSEYPRPQRRAGQAAPVRSGAEHMSPDPATPYSGAPVEVTDAEVRADELLQGAATDSPAGAGAFPPAPDSTLFGGGQTLADELARRGGAEKSTEGAAENATTFSGPRAPRGRLDALWLGTVAVVQSVLAVLLGAGLFLSFDQLWRWNSIVALVLSVLVILGLVVGVRVVRKTEDITSTLIAVAVGALITLGPLALSLRSG